eukprot:TRINITY_DN5372_c0_g5_i1.p1 TRINITY_DN5372_c0_g5~~TRINITY_DN5372_c0_g5_i1.p1  ORF type:complete len:553 (+),score=51.18 TRINITY_DN5372_c0_g5_i1:84-1742(+)
MDSCRKPAFLHLPLLSCVVVSALGNACIPMNPGATTPASGTLVVQQFSQKVPAGFTLTWGQGGVFCPDCSGTSCDYSRCHDVEHQYEFPADGTLRGADGKETSVARGERRSTGGRFCPKCKNMAQGDVADAAGVFLSDDFKVYAHHVPAGMIAPMAGLFCHGKAPAPLKEFQLVITPSWTNYASFNEAKGMLSGSMAVEYQWYWFGKTGYAGGRISEPHLAVNLVNFASGASGRVVSGMYQDTPATDLEFRRSVVTYVGEFQQSLDGTCYPWDEQTIRFEFRLPWPYNTMMEFVVRCTGSDDMCDQGYVCAPHEIDPWGNCMPEHLRSITNVRFEGKISKQFEWSALRCEKMSSEHVVCSMRGKRVFTKNLVMLFVPGLLLSFIGFGSFLIPYTMAMPRVATTMIALLTFVNKGSVAIAVMPSVGFNVIEEFYIFGMIIMMVNMIGHILSWKKPVIAHLVNELQLGFVLLAFVLFFCCSIYSRECDGTSSSGLLAAIVLLTLLLLASLVWSFYRHRKELKVAFSYAKDNAMKLKNVTLAVIDDDEGEAVVTI